MSRTIESIEKNFIVIGTLEEMDKSFAVMECLIPEYLSGIVDLKRKFMIHKHSKHKKNVELSEDARKVIRERLNNEYLVYEYVKKRLDKQFKECLQAGKISVNSRNL